MRQRMFSADDDDDDGGGGGGGGDDDDDHLCFWLHINLFHLLLLVQLTEQALGPVHQLVLFGLGITMFYTFVRA